MTGFDEDLFGDIFWKLMFSRVDKVDYQFLEHVFQVLLKRLCHFGHLARVFTELLVREHEMKYSFWMRFKGALFFILNPSLHWRTFGAKIFLQYV
jgi:hypothetical protein